MMIYSAGQGTLTDRERERGWDPASASNLLLISREALYSS